MFDHFFSLAIEIDLKSPELATTTKYHARLENALSNETLSTFKMRLTWEPPKEKVDSQRICPSSLAKYFADLGYEVDLNQTDCRIHFEYSLHVPRLGPESDDLVDIHGESKFFATPHELVEYAGMLALSCNTDTSEYLNTWSFSGHTVDVGQALVIRLKGLFTCNLIRALFKRLK